MVDGIKIQVPITTAEKWLNSPLLNFKIGFSERTGSIMDKSMIAQARGLIFTIRFHDESLREVVECEVKGSIHKFYNNGKNNADDFNVKKLNMALEMLEVDYCIELATARLRNIEVGVNIHTPIKANDIIKNLVAYKGYEFETFTCEGKRIGKQVLQQRHRFKIYNKGKQNKYKSDNLLRIEIAFKKMIDLKQYDIVYLSDVLNVKKIHPLYVLLLKWWDNVIYYDKSIKLLHLSPTAQRRVLYLATPRNWVDFNNDQRYKAKKRFRELMNKYGSTTQNDISHIISNKWKELTAEKGRQINRLYNGTEKQKKGDKLTVKIKGLNIAFSSSNNTLKKTGKNTKKGSAILKGCKTCKTDISHKRKTAMFCSKKCNNSFHGSLRTTKRRKERAKQKKELERLMRVIPKKQMSLIVYYKADGVIYSDGLYQTEIRTTKEWVRSVQKVEVSEYRKNGKAIILTSYRARKLIKLIDLANK